MSDLRQISRVARGFAPVFPGIDLKPLVAELQAPRCRRARLPPRGGGAGGLRRGLRRPPRHRRARASSPSATEVLVTEWLDSAYSLAQVIREGTQEERDHYGELFVRFLFEGPRRTGMLHADPHPGNFRVIPAADGGLGRLGVLDFGAVARLPQGQLPEAMGRLIRIALRVRRGVAGRRAPRGGVHQGPHRGRPGDAARLPRAVRRAGRPGALHLHPRVDARRSSSGSTTPAPRRSPSPPSSTCRPPTSSSTAPGSAPSACSASWAQPCRSGRSSRSRSRASRTTEIVEVPSRLVARIFHVVTGVPGYPGTRCTAG